MIYWDYYPKLDVHGETRDTVNFVLKEFINDNIKLNQDIIVIIHGKGEGILKREVHYLLRQNRNVLQFHLVLENPGMTIVKLKR